MTDPYEGYAIVELMGHRRLAGRVSQAEQYGVAMLRLDVPREDGTDSTHFFGGASIYAVHPTSEEIARQVAESCDPAPVQRWELPTSPRELLKERDAFTEAVLDEHERDRELDRVGSLVDCEYNDEDDQLEVEPPVEEPSDLEVTDSCASCEPGKPCEEHEPF